MSRKKKILTAAAVVMAGGVVAAAMVLSHKTAAPEAKSYSLNSPEGQAIHRRMIQMMQMQTQMKR
jgi:hypothetical protein